MLSLAARYGIVILVFEAIGATTSLIYGLNHLFYTINNDVVDDVSGIPKLCSCSSAAFAVHECRHRRRAL